MDTDATQLRPLIEVGLTLIPLHDSKALAPDGRELGKAPRDRAWQSKDYSRFDAEQHMMAGGNAGVRLDGLMVCDADIRHYRPGDDPLARAFADGLLPANAPRVITGGGGAHVYMRLPADTPSTVETLPDYPGLEFKRGPKQVVAPGSVHPKTQKLYEVDPFDDAFNAIPDAPAALLGALTRPERQGGAEWATHEPEQIARMLSHLDPTKHRGGGPGGAWYSLMCACHHASGGDAADEFIEWSERDPQYVGAGHAVRMRWDSLSKSGSGGGAITAGSLHHILKEAGVAEAWERGHGEVQDDFDDDPAMADEPPGDALPQGPLTAMNEQYWAVLNAGRFRVMWLADDPEEPGRRFWKSLAKPDFEAYLSNRKIEKQTKNKKGEMVTETMPLAKAWLDWGRRRSAENVVFVPDREVPGSLNLWTGWGVDSRESGECRLMLEMIRDVLCSGVQEHYDYLMRWMAWKVQNPGEPNEVAVVFKGAKGVGKTTLGESLAKIFGSHGLVLSSVEQIAGRFSGHLATVCFLFGDEIFWGGNKTHEGTLKKIITDREVMREAKGVDMVRARNRISLMMATNEKWAVPASLEGERRFFVLNVSSERKVPDSAPADHPNRLYWNAVHDEIRDGGRAALLRYLMAMDLKGFHPRSAVPETQGMSEQKEHSLDPLQRWLLSATELGVLPGYPSSKDLKQIRRKDWDSLEQDWSKVEAHDPPRLDPTSVMEDVAAHWTKLRSPIPSLRIVWALLEDFGWKTRKSNGIVTWRPPALEDARQEWRRRLPGLSVFGTSPDDDEWDS